jgi:hypothetical protein
MFSYKGSNFAVLLFLCGITSHSFAQNSPTQIIVSNQYPCGECAVYDNNGNDLRGFISKNKRDFNAKGAVVLDYSNNTWGYLQIKNAKVPSVNKRGDLNYHEYIDATLALEKTTDGAKATWWARETNAPKGPLVYIPTKDKDKLDIGNVRYTEVMHDLETKKFTLAEYTGDTYNEYDFDQMAKNYILMQNGTLKDLNDYKLVIDYFNNFLTKFSNLKDPFLEHKSFLAFLGFNNHKYIAYFNVVNSKLAGHLEVLDLQYETDKEPLVKYFFKKLTGKTVFVYGDNLFGMEKTIIKYARPKNIKVIRKMPNDTKTFNGEK